MAYAQICIVLEERVKYGKGIATVPQFPNGDFLMVRLMRTPAIGYSLEFPRGGVEDGEDSKTGAMRELQEETGFAGIASGLKLLGRVGADTATLNGTQEIW